MSRTLSYLNPLPTLVSACLSLALIHDLLRCLPRPCTGGPADYGRQMIQDALAAADLLGPRDRLEAAIAVQMVVLQRQAREAAAAAAAEPDFDKRLRIQRHEMALLRRHEALGRNEAIEEPPMAPEGVAVQAPPEPRLTQQEADALTPEQRWRRYGSRLEPEVFGVRPAVGARA